jgi:LL-diaminopimelate aminotransferase
MIERNACITNLKAGYLFPEIARRRRAFEAAHPDTATKESRVISLGVGNTTEPLPPHITAGLVEGARRLGTVEGYSGYADEGFPALRQRIIEAFYSHIPGLDLNIDEVFISDGAKCDIGRLQTLFGAGVKVAVQDPSYPVYVDGSVLNGAAQAWVEGGGGYGGISYLPCTAENNYFPDLGLLPTDCILYFCSPNNPTGVAATRLQLEALVNTALERGALIIFDAAYACYIRDPALPRTIYEIEGARRCAIEVNSFSKPAGFTGVRLGWSIVPKDLAYSGGSADAPSLNADWSRVCSTVFNGASNIAQWGGLAALDDEGQAEMKGVCDFYLGNAALIRSALEGLGVSCIGGDNSPYIWAQFPGRDSWEVFAEILEKCRVVTTPGSGFGPAGQSFIRFSAFGHRPDIEEACTRLKQRL